jgi:glycosyltransferase involved in cell wall biosynthesis
MTGTSPLCRLALVGPLPPPPGGMANQTRQLAQLLRAEGLDVRLVRTNESYRPTWIGGIRGARALFRLAPFLRSVLDAARHAQLMHVMANSGWSWFLTAAPAIHAGAWRAVPVIVNYRGGLAREFLASSGRFVLPTLRRAGAVVVPSRFLQEVFAQYGVATRIIPNVVDLGIFQPAQSSGRTASAAHVVITRNLEKIYGIDTALRAIAILRKEFPQLRASIAGSGPERATLEKLTVELGLAGVVRFTGRLEIAEVAALYRDADIALNPSRVDNTPNSILEAAACGVPIVSTNVGGVPYLVEHGQSAWLVPADRPVDMAAGVARVLRDATLGRALRENGRALAKSCGWDVVRQQWLDLYAAVVQSSPRRLSDVMALK